MGQGGVMGRVAVAGVTILALVGVLSGGLVGAADPDFSDVTDILGGQRHLLRDDDLVIDVASGFQRYVLQTQGLQVTSQNATTVVSTSACTGLLQSRVGRLFNLQNDVVVTLAPLSTAGSGCSGSPNLGFYISDPRNAANNSQTNFTANAGLSQIALDDFNGDGYADILYINQDTMSVYTARNTDDPAQGVINVTPEGLRVAPRADPVLDTLQPEPVTGDFNGDGAIDVAWAQIVVGQWFVFFVSVCPAANVAVLGETCSQAFQIIGAIPFLQLGGGPDSSPPLPFVVVAAGDYDGVLNAQGRLTHELFVVASLNGAGGPNQGHQLSTYSFDAMLTPTQRSTAFFGFSSLEVPDQAFVASGRLGWFGQQDQVVFGSWQTQIISVITFDTNLNMTAHSHTLTAQDGPLYGLAVGRFDPPGVNGTLNPNLQIAALVEPGVPEFGIPAKTELQIFTVDPPNNYTPQLASTHVIANAWLFPVNFNDPFCAQCAQPVPVYGNPLQAGDLQGRSLPLGAPQKVTVTGSIQPQVVLGLPPMHLDFICDATNPGPGCTPAVLNLSTLPSKYYSQYQTQQSNSAQSANTNTTSYTVATKESAEAKFSYGIPDLASVSVDLKTSAQQTHQNTVSDKYNTYSNKQFDVSTQTGFSDLVWFTAKRFNLYYYPVLGQWVCPQSQPDCTDAQKVPLHVVFSGPDQVIQNRIDGNLLEWYQPVQEAGNVFSYPWSITLLQDFYAGFNALTANPATVWATDSSGSTVSVTWSEGSGSSVTSGSVSTQAFDVSASAASSINIEGFGANLSAGFDYNSSSSVSTLNESSSTLGSSTGIKIVKPPFVNPGQYAYAAQTYIFGQQAPTGTVQEIPLSTTVQSSGPLWTAFLADPTDTGDGAGLWWPQAYTKPDVALNHPQRWTWTPPTPSKGDVLAFNAPNASDPAGSEFYLMKGLYITPASANGLGPQITQAAAGEALQLQARVYNYSLADMPAGSTVHVRFYGQKWDNSAHNFSGPAFVIQEVMLNPIPGFNSTATGGETPNWTLASATFDTTNYGDTYLIFWVVVWMERNGQLVPEIEGHGITAIPGATTAPTAVAIEAYSNNVGFYRQPFFVAPQTSQRARTAAPAASSLAVDEVAIAPARVRLFDKATVSATLTTGDASLGAVPVFFYDGDPQRGSEAFDAELIPHIRANNTYVTRVKFQPRTCGQHTVVVVAGPGTAAPATGQATVDVVIDPVASVDELTTATTSLDLPTQTERSLVTKLNMAKRAFAHHAPWVATNRLTAFIGAVEVQRGTTLTDEQADSLIGEAKLIISCV